MNTLLRDAQYALRGFRKNPAFAAVAILSLGLGIGANTAIFSLTDQVLLRSLPVQRPQELVLLTANGPRRGDVETSYDSDYTFSYPMYRDFRDRSPVFSAVIAWFPTAASFSFGGRTELIRINLVTGNFFDALGVQTILGRAITLEDDRVPGASPVAVLSYGFWVSRFGANPAILNQTVNVNNHLLTVIGVAPPGFHGLAVGESPALFVPVTMESQMMPGRAELEKRRSMWLNVIARLKPGGASRASAEAAMNAFWQPILQEELSEIKQPTDSLKQRFLNRHLSLIPAANGVSSLRLMFKAPLILLMALVALVLLIACANVANLMIARAAGRRKEMAIRLALGASRGDIVRQILVESVILALAGGAVAVLLASWTGGMLVRLLPFGSLTGAISTDPDIRVLAFTAAVSILSGIFFGLAPALQTTRHNVASTLKDQAANIAGGSTQVIYRKALVVVQVALSLVLLIGAGLFLRSLGKLRDIDPGFRADHLISFSINPSLNGYDTARAVSLFDQLIARVKALPGVSATGVSGTPLLTGDNDLSSIEVPGREPREGDETPNFDLVSPGFFRALGIGFLAGREFTDADANAAPKVAIVNDTLARAYFGSDNPIGRHFNFSGDKTRQIEIIGVVKAGKYADLREKKQGFIFCPYSQRYTNGAMTFYVRTDQQPETVSAAFRQTVQNQDANLPLFDLKTMEQQIDESVFADRIISGLSAVFGLLATVLAAIGLYGVLSYSVSRRTAEIGIRVALGANQRTVLSLVLREGIALIAVGVLCGCAAAFAISRLIANLLYQVSASDPLTFLGFSGVMVIVSLAAIYIPARRAARLDPVVALRSQ